jgi:hypothetical protein
MLEAGDWIGWNGIYTSHARQIGLMRTNLKDQLIARVQTRATTGKSERLPLPSLLRRDGGRWLGAKGSGIVPCDEI